MLSTIPLLDDEQPISIDSLYNVAKGHRSMSLLERNYVLRHILRSKTADFMALCEENDALVAHRAYLILRAEEKSCTTPEQF